MIHSHGSTRAQITGPNDPLTRLHKRQITAPKGPILRVQMTPLTALKEAKLLVQQTPSHGSKRAQITGPNDPSHGSKRAQIPRQNDPFSWLQMSPNYGSDWPFLVAPTVDWKPSTRAPATLEKSGNLKNHLEKSGNSLFFQKIREFYDKTGASYEAG